MRLAALASFLLLLAGALAGCSGSQGDAGTGANVPTGPPPASNATVDHLGWELGEYWVHHWYIGKNDTAGFTVKVVVAENRTGAWLIAADDPTNAGFHGAFVFPTLGVFGVKTTAADVGDNHWPWYHFPLQNGTWTDTLTSRGGDGKPYALPVTTAVSKVPGKQRAYDLEMRTGTFLVAKYDYSATNHWFSEARIYDTAKDSAPDEWVVRIVTEEHGFNFRGPYYEDTGDVLLSYENVQTPGATPTPTASFTMTAEQNKLLLLRVTFAADGAQETTILDPNMDATTKTIYHQEAYGAEGQTVTTDLVVGIPGTWQVVGTGAGVATGSLVYAYGIHERMGTL